MSTKHKVKYSPCCDDIIFNGFCMDCGSIAGNDICNTCFGLKKVTENIGQHDERTYPCPDCVGIKEEDTESRYNNEVNR